MPSSPEPPARRGEKGEPNKYPERNKKEGERKAKHTTALVGEEAQCLSTLALAVARNELAAVARLGEIPVPGGSWACLLAWGRKLPCAADVDF